MVSCGGSLYKYLSSIKCSGNSCVYGVCRPCCKNLKRTATLPKPRNVEEKEGEVRVNAPAEKSCSCPP